MPRGVHWPFVKETRDRNEKYMRAQQVDDMREGNEGERESKRSKVYTIYSARQGGLCGRANMSEKGKA
jgi:hypothetical protein